MTEEATHSMHDYNSKTSLNLNRLRKLPKKSNAGQSDLNFFNPTADETIVTNTTNALHSKNKRTTGMSLTSHALIKGVEPVGVPTLRSSLAH